MNSILFFSTSQGTHAILVTLLNITHDAVIFKIWGDAFHSALAVYNVLRNLFKKERHL
jgi:DNA-binding protein